jgi:hypothetical protein
MVVKSDGNYAEEPTNCDGSTASVISALTCTIYQADLLTAPHLLSLGDVAYTKVIAFNAIGDSNDSPIADSTFLRTAPDAPVLRLKTRGATDLELEWDAPFNGGAAIIDYRISYDESTGNWIYLQSYIIERDFLVTGLLNAVTYTFKIEARNVYGFSVES